VKRPARKAGLVPEGVGFSGPQRGKGLLGAKMKHMSAGRAVRTLVTGVALFALVAGPVQAQTTQYTYDALGRLVSAIDQNGKKVAYTYDSVGNRTRLSNGAEFQEILPTAWTASSNAGTTGLTAANGLRDGVYNTLASIHATQAEAGAWIKADLGSLKNVNHIEVAPASVSSVGAGPEDLNDARLEYSADGTVWKYAATVSGAVAGATRTLTLGGVSLRYLRLSRAATGQMAIGDLKLFSAATSNSSLIAQPDQVTSAGAAVTFDPRTNDQDLDGYSFTISSADAPIHGTAVVNSGASITYTPTAGYFGADSFSYAVADGHNGTATAQVSVMVRSGANHAPTALADQYAIARRASAAVDGTVALRVLNNDYDQDGGALTITAATAAAHGQTALQAGNAVTYQPAVGYVGTDSFTYTVSDGLLTATATVSLTIGNSAPIAAADTGTTPKNTAVILSPKANDSDPNGDAINLWSVAQPGHGTTTFNTDETVTYTPTTGYLGADSFTYVIADPAGLTTSGTVSLTVYDPNPSKYLSVMVPATYASQVTVNATTFTVPSNSNANVYVDTPMATGKFYWEVKLLCGYIFPGASNNTNSAYSWGGFGSRNAGIRTSNAQTWTYTLDPQTTGFNSGSVNDVYGFALDADARTLSIYKNNIQGPTISLIVDPPYFAHAGAQPYVGSALAGQACADGPASGQFLVADTGLTYLPPDGYSGLHDQMGNRAPTAVDDATTVLSYNSRQFDPRLNDIDLDRDWLTITSVGAPSHGGVTISPGGASVTYTPTGSYTGADAFTYAISDGHGGAASATVNITVAASTPPQAANDTLTAPSGTLTTFDPRQNDSDPDADGLTISSVTTPGHGSAIVSSGTAVTYQSQTGYVGADAFSYTITDGRGQTSTALVSVNVVSSARIFTISPAVAGKTTWNLDVDGQLNLSTPGTWTLTPNGTFSTQTKAWGGGGGVACCANSGGAGGYAGATVQYQAGVAYKLYVGGGGAYSPMGANGGLNGGGNAGNASNSARGSGGGGYSGVRLAVGDGVLIAGGGGGEGWGGAGGGGGGSTAQSGAAFSGILGGGGGGGTSYQGADGQMNSNGGEGGGGGGGYMGGGGGQTPLTANGGGGGGGGTGYASSTATTGAVLTAAVGTTPGNSGDTDRSGAGATQSAGRVILAGVLINKTPVAASDSLLPQPGVAVTFDPRANDSDPDGDALTVTAVSTPGHGATTYTATSVTYTPTASYVGSDSFTYTVSDGHGGTASAAVTATMANGTRSFFITPAVNGKSTWNIDVDGPLNLATAGIWTITPTATFTSATKAWGAGGGSSGCCATNGGAGAYSGGSVLFSAGASYKLYVGGGGAYSPMGANGGLNGGGNAGNASNSARGSGGGGYSGVRTAVGAALLIAGGGGGQGWGGAGGGGGQSAPDYLGAGNVLLKGGTGGGGTSYQGVDGQMTSNGGLGGGGGGGYLGGGGGQSLLTATGGSGGGGGTGYASSTASAGVVLTAAVGPTPANSSDSDRGAAAEPASGTNTSGQPGRLILGTGH
jgi:YD repeat-containing protein